MVWRRSVWEWTAGRRGERAAVASSERAYLVRGCVCFAATTTEAVRQRFDRLTAARRIDLIDLQQGDEAAVYRYVLERRVASDWTWW